MAKTGTWVYRNGKLVPKHKAEPLARNGVRNVISDYLPDLIHPQTGKRMDSKSEFRKVTRAKGGVEMGNERHVDRRHETGTDSQTRKADIAQAIRELGG